MTARPPVAIDPGGEADRILARAEKTGRSIGAILHTHGHLDHAGGTAQLHRLLGSELIEEKSYKAY